MIKLLMRAILTAGILLLSVTAYSAPLSVSADDSLQSVLAAHKGKTVTVKLNSGEELTGKVGDVTGKLVVLQELSGKEFFDAAISLEKVAAIVVRAKE